MSLDYPSGRLQRTGQNFHDGRFPPAIQAKETTARTRMYGNVEVLNNVVRRSGVFEEDITCRDERSGKSHWLGVGK